MYIVKYSAYEDTRHLYINEEATGGSRRHRDIIVYSLLIMPDKDYTVNAKIYVTMKIPGICI